VIERPSSGPSKSSRSITSVIVLMAAQLILVRYSAHAAEPAAQQLEQSGAAPAGAEKGTSIKVGAESNESKRGGAGLDNETPKSTGFARKFGDWALVCPEKSEDDAHPGCRLIQSAILNVEPNAGSEPHSERVMLTAVGYIENHPEPLLTLIVPLGILLTPGLLFDVEGYDQLRVPLQRCDANGCLGVLEMKDQLVEAFRKGKQAQVAFFNIAGKPNKVRISLSGFGQAVEELSKYRKK
jgi:invasion protein IalB